jgi:hypothetical protein
MERQMRLNEDILRHLTVVVDKHEDLPSVLSLKRQEGENTSSHGHNKSFHRDGNPKEGGYRRHVAADSVEGTDDNISNVDSTSQTA